MIDAESLIFSEVSAKVRQEYPGIFMTGEFVKVPSSFPCISLVEIDNATLQETQTSSLRENHAVVVYELNVYSNKKTGKKSECKEIAGFVNDRLMDLNFTRIMLEPVPNQEDNTIYRMLGRYRAAIGKDNTFYRR